jgi:lipooligosaccharide transport system permease protein
MSTGTAFVAPSPSPVSVLEHRLMALRRTWRGNIFTSLLMPVLFLLGIGVSVGGYVDRAGTLGLPYLDYIAPGLLASTAAQIAVAESMYPVLAAFRWTRTYHAMRASPLRAADIVAGETLYSLLRVGLPSVSFLLVMTAFGTVHSWWAPAAVPACMLTGLSMSGAVVAYSASIKSDNMFAFLYRLVVIPMTLFAGVFFPVESLPTVVRWLAYGSPLWHGVQLCRYATLGLPSALPVVAHVGYLALWAVVGHALARRQFARRLLD